MSDDDRHQRTDADDAHDGPADGPGEDVGTARSPRDATGTDRRRASGDGPGASSDRERATTERHDDATTDWPASRRFAAVSQRVREPGELTDLSRRGSVLLEYVTFGYGAHHLLKSIVLQFVVLFLDAGLLRYTQRPTGTHQAAITAVWLVASVVFLGILAVLVRRIGRRTLTPRFHRPVHVVGSVAGYLVASGLSFAFGYVTFIYPRRDPGTLSLQELLPGVLLVLVFATFLAIGYHAQVDVTDRPSPAAINDVIGAWLDALDWVELDDNSFARETAYDEFVDRTDDLGALLTHARTVEGRELADDFHGWREAFENHAMLSKERIVTGPKADGSTGSARLAAKQDDLRNLTERLEVVAGIDE